MTEVVVLTSTCLLTAVATWSDLRSYRIPNLIPLLLLLLGFVAAGAGLRSNVSFGQALLGLILGFILMFPFFALGVMGAGDVKLMAGLGAIVGSGQILGMIFWMAVFGGVHGMILKLMYGSSTAVDLKDVGEVPASAIPETAPSLTATSPPRHAVPYALAIFFGLLMQLFLPQWSPIK